MKKIILLFFGSLLFLNLQGQTPTPYEHKARSSDEERDTLSVYTGEKEWVNYPLRIQVESNQEVVLDSLNESELYYRILIGGRNIFWIRQERENPFTSHVAMY